MSINTGAFDADGADFVRKCPTDTDWARLVRFWMAYRYTPARAYCYTPALDAALVKLKRRHPTKMSLIVFVSNLKNDSSWPLTVPKDLKADDLTTEEQGTCVLIKHFTFVVRQTGSLEEKNSLERAVANAIALVDDLSTAFFEVLYGDWFQQFPIGSPQRQNARVPYRHASDLYRNLYERDKYSLYAVCKDQTDHKIMIC